MKHLIPFLALFLILTAASAAHAQSTRLNAQQKLQNTLNDRGTKLPMTQRITRNLNNDGSEARTPMNRNFSTQRGNFRNAARQSATRNGSAYNGDSEAMPMNASRRAAMRRSFGRRPVPVGSSTGYNN